MLQAFECILARNAKYDFFIAAQIGGAGVERFDFPALAFRKARIHAVEVSRKQSRFGTACAGANFDDCIA